MHFGKVLGFRASGSGFREKCLRGLNNEGASRELEEAWKGGKLVGRSIQGFMLSSAVLQGVAA